MTRARTLLYALAPMVLLGMNASPAGGVGSITSTDKSQDKARLIVLTDVGSDPDDQQSLVRLLAYANDLDIEGIIASTSAHLRHETHREMIEERIAAYAQALSNLRVHDPSYPAAEQLLKTVRAGRPLYGMAGVGKGMDSEATSLIIAAVDRPDPRPVCDENYREWRGLRNKDNPPMKLGSNVGTGICHFSRL